ncbi:MAG: trigger factor [Actinobacteria bacterium]|nr:trigger factor [Actinomycetota bacterium]
MSTANVEELGENRVRLTVEVPPAQVKHAVEHAVSDLAESVKLPGFRKGKIPQPVLISRLGKDRIYAEAVDSHIGGWFWSAASRNRVRPVTDPQFEFELPSTADEPWTFSATVEVQPTPEIVDWTTLEVARSEVEVPQDAIDAEIEALRESIAELTPAESRPARIGDTVVIDLADSAGEAQRDTVVELGTGQLAPELEQQIVGASPGETKEIAYQRPDGISGTIGVTLLEVNEKVLPAVDDELARAASEFDTLAELRASVESTFREQLDAEIDAAFRMAAVDELVKTSKVQPALPLVQSRAADLLTGFVRSLERRGISLESYLQVSGTSGEDLQRQMILEAAVSIARELALEALAQRAGIEISDEDVKAYLREEAESADESADGLIEDVWAHGQQESVRDDLRLRAALDRLVADVKPIAPDLAEAREKLWTPDKDKEKAASDTKLWTPGHPASQDG